MDKADIDKHHVIERYLLNQLTTDERDAFEQLFLDDPELLDRLEQAEAMRAGLRQATDALESSDSPRAAFAGWFAKPAVAYGVSGVAVIALAASALLFAERGQVDETPIATPVGVEVWLETTRGAERTVRVSRQPALIRVDIGPPPHAARYRLAIAHGTQTVIEAGDLTVDGDNAISIVISKLPAGEYVVAVAADDEQATDSGETTYAIQVDESGEP